MILLIDNYDSFTYNLYHQIGQYEPNIQVVRNDEITIAEIEALSPAAIVISPGPGTPAEAGICIEVIQQLYKKYAILGVCLGHQAIGEAFGATVRRAERIIHGKTSMLSYEKSGLLQNIEGPIEVMRYHSLVIEPTTLAKEFVIDAIAADDQEIMAIHHHEYPLFGVQFHPESIGTALGNEMIEYFIKQIKVEQ